MTSDTIKDIERLESDTWQRDYWDRNIRDERHFHAVKAYIEISPVMAGLAIMPEDWPWSSAYEKAHRMPG